MNRSLKTILQIAFFLLALVYVFARIGLHTYQARTDKSGPKIEEAESKSHIPDSIHVAKKYIRKFDCDTLGTVTHILHVPVREVGIIKATSVAETENGTCSYHQTYRFEFMNDSLTIHFSGGTMLQEAPCPEPCRSRATLLSGKQRPVLRDTLDNGKTYKILQFPGYKIYELW